MVNRQLRTDFSAGEVSGALVWLSIASAVSCLLEVVYLTAWIELPGGMKLPFPWTILVAAFFNVVLTRTARLWSKRVWVAAIPTIIWFLIFLLLAFGGSSAISPLLFPSARMILLFTAGMMGGLGPLIVAK